MEQVLLRQHYFEDTKIEVIELSSWHNKNKDQIKQTYQKDTQIQKIKEALEKEEKEMKGVALGLWHWKDEHLWYEGKIWIPEDEGLRTTFISQCHYHLLAGHGGTAKTTELVSRHYYWPKMEKQLSDMSKTVTRANGAKQSDMHPTGYYSQIKFQTNLGGLSQWTSSLTYQNPMDMIRY